MDFTRSKSFTQSPLGSFIRISLALRLPLVQYSVTIQIFGGSMQAPMNAQILSCRRSRIWNTKKSKNEQETIKNGERNSWWLIRYVRCLHKHNTTQSKDMSSVSWTLSFILSIILSFNRPIIFMTIFLQIMNYKTE